MKRGSFREIKVLTNGETVSIIIPALRRWYSSVGRAADL